MEKQKMKSRRAVVVGGGLVGAVTALSLSKLGFHVQLFERRSSMLEDMGSAAGEASEAVVKRSINLALSRRGQEALSMLGLLEAAMEKTIPMYGRAIHTSDDCDKVSFQMYDEADEKNFINSISRSELLKILLQAAENDRNIQVSYAYELVSIGQDHALNFKDLSDGSNFIVYDVDLVVGCDGANSNVRDRVMRFQSCTFKREYINHSYKELQIEPDTAKKWKLKPINALHIWPRGDFMLIALPNPDFSFTCTLFAPNSVFESLENEKNTQRVEEFFAINFPDIVRLMPDYIEQFQKNRSSTLVSTRIDPWYTLGTSRQRKNLRSSSGKGKNVKLAPILLLGDAAHAMVPFFGQGMNSGMEDALEFYETLAEYGLGNIEEAVVAFAAQRAPRGRAIQDLSLKNYVEMRSHTSSRLFLARKRIEGFLNRLFPKCWIPLYKMVSFTRIPYDEAVIRAEKQDKILSIVSYTTIGLAAFLVAGGGFALIKCNTVYCSLCYKYILGYSIASMSDRPLAINRYMTPDGRNSIRWLAQTFHRDHGFFSSFGRGLVRNYELFPLLFCITGCVACGIIFAERQLAYSPEVHTGQTRRMTIKPESVATKGKNYMTHRESMRRLASVGRDWAVPKTEK